MKKRLLIIILPITFILICATVIIGIVLFRNHPTVLNYDEAATLYPEERMLEFDETYYFNGTEIKEDRETGTVWRVDYNGHVSAFKFIGGSDWVDYAVFILSPEDTQKIWDLADSLEGDFVPSGYEGYSYCSVLYKYTDKGEKSLKKFSGLAEDYPSAKEIFTILSDNYKTVSDNSNEETVISNLGLEEGNEFEKENEKDVNSDLNNIFMESEKIELSEQDFAFEYKGKTFSFLSNWNDYVDALGYPNEYEQNNYGYISTNNDGYYWGMCYPSQSEYNYDLYVVFVSPSRQREGDDTFVHHISLKQVETARGIKAGDSAEDLADTYGKPYSITNHDGDSNWTDITYNYLNHSIVFVIEDNKVLFIDMNL